MNFDVKMKTYILFTLFYFFGAKAESSNETFGNSYKEIKNYFNSYFRTDTGETGGPGHWGRACVLAGGQVIMSHVTRLRWSHDVYNQMHFWHILMS